MTLFKFGVVTLFPKMLIALEYGVIGRAISEKIVELTYFNPRDFTTDKHRTVDDRPYGGGPGMVMKFAPLHAAIQAAKAALGNGGTLCNPAKTILLSPQGKPLTQERINRAASERQSLILIAGRYEGIDERVIETDVDEEWSVGDYVVTGGELPAMLCIDAITRLLPGVLGHEDSAIQDSFATGLLDYPHYTRPEVIEDKSVPAILLHGDHNAIATWRRKQALGRTWQRRKDLLKRQTLTEDDQRLLNQFITETELKTEQER